MSKKTNTKKEKDNIKGNDSELHFKKKFVKSKLKNRTANLIAKIDDDTSRLLDAMVSLDIAPSRSAAAAFLINDAFEKDKENYLKILETYEIIRKAKAEAKNIYFKSMENTEEEEETENKE